MFVVRARSRAMRFLGLFPVVSVLCNLLALGAPVSAQTPPTEPAPQPIVAPADVLSFVGDILPQRQRDLYTMRVDGTDKKQLTQGFNVWFASWSPDGKQLAVTTEGSDIYTLNADGSDQSAGAPSSRLLLVNRVRSLPTDSAASGSSKPTLLSGVR